MFATFFLAPKQVKLFTVAYVSVCRGRSPSSRGRYLDFLGQAKTSKNTHGPWVTL